VLLRDTTTDDLAMLLMGSDPAHSQIEFGAHQAVLVRNQAAKERLPQEFASALKLTIFEAKGLEFDDVFVVDFFEDSPADERTWRVVTGCWEARPTPAEAAAGAPPPAAAGAHASAAHQAVQDGAALGFDRPTRGAEPFDAVRHSLLNEELKMFCDRPSATRTSDPHRPLQDRMQDRMQGRLCSPRARPALCQTPRSRARESSVSSTTATTRSGGRCSTTSSRLASRRPSTRRRSRAA